MRPPGKPWPIAFGRTPTTPNISTGTPIGGIADDWEAGGPVRVVCRGYENAPRGAVIHPRLLAGVFSAGADRSSSRAG